MPPSVVVDDPAMAPLQRKLLEPDASLPAVAPRARAKDGPGELAMEGCVADLPLEASTHHGSSVIEVAARQSTMVGKRIRITALLAYRPPLQNAVLTSYHDGLVVRITLDPVPALVAHCAGEVCVTLDATVGKRTPGGSSVRDGDDGVLRDAILVARSQTCEAADALPTSLPAVIREVQNCKADGGPIGEGHVSITLSPNGTVTLVHLDTLPYFGTGVGACVERMFHRVRVPPFNGDSRTIGERFTIQ
jgi:hypothetical protein